ncbi:MAG: class I SAM-dependent methyltransferase [Gracilibacteraceae bacterium]|nr:class I SAM-dependent methyltransferase [Gracilibacteraceae bacterium]
MKVYARFSRPGDERLRRRLERLAAAPGLDLAPLPPLPRGEEDDATPTLHITRSGLYLTLGAAKLFFHPGMALLRVMRARRGEYDRFLSLADVRSGDTVLDATAGLGADALVAAWAVGERGRVVGTECAPLVFALLRDGLENFSTDWPGRGCGAKGESLAELGRAAERVQAHRAEHTEFLRALPDGAVDIVCFDPMFRSTVAEAAAMQALKLWSSPVALGAEAVAEACRVARRRVVLKERRGSGEFARLGFHLPAQGGSKVCYGVIKRD